MLWKNQFSGPAGQAGNEQGNIEALENSDEENDLAARWKQIEQMRNQIDKRGGVVEDLRNELK
ncbi:MAG: hypothetical protein ACYTBS_24595 [Planctomycetota bacterium]|jgi:hypothetical protein